MSSNTDFNGFKVTDTLTHEITHDNITYNSSTSISSKGNINTFKTIYEDLYIKCVWNPIHKQLLFYVFYNHYVIRGTNELINSNGNNTSAFQLTPVIDSSYYFHADGVTTDSVFSFDTSWNKSEIRFTSISSEKMPFYTIKAESFANDIFFTIQQFVND